MTQNTVKMSACSLRAIMGEAFDYEAYEEGRRDARKLFKEKPDIRKEKLDEIKQIIANGDYRNKPGPSYWIGGLTEIDFYW